MITPHLEELICTGKAQVKTLALTGGASIFAMPQGKHVVITQITAYPFFDLPAGEDMDKSDNLQKISMHQLRIGSKLSSNHFMYRWSFRGIFDGAISPANTSFVPEGQPVTNDTYLLHQDNIFFEWLHNPKLSAWGTAVQELPERSNPQKPILGYGSAATGAIKALSILKYGDVLNSEVRPFSTFLPPTVPTNTFSQFQFGVSDDTRLNVKNPVGKNWAYTFPILNVQLVVIDGTPKQRFKPSV